MQQGFALRIWCNQQSQLLVAGKTAGTFRVVLQAFYRNILASSGSYFEAGLGLVSAFSLHTRFTEIDNDKLFDI